MPGYPKIWTSLLSEDWFTPLPINAKGVYLWLILEAKRQGDTGRISSTGLAALAQQMVIDRSTLANTLSKFQQIKKVAVIKKAPHLLVLEIRNYRKYQDLKKYKLESQRSGGVENSTSNEQQPEQSGNQTKPEEKKSAGAKEAPLLDKREDINNINMVDNEDNRSGISRFDIAQDMIWKRFDLTVSKDALKKIMLGSDGYEGFGNLQRLSMALNRIKGMPDDPVRMLIDFSRHPEKYLTGDREYDEWKAIK